MKQFEDHFVSKDTSIKLKEKGFNEPCLAVYRGNDLYFDKMICGYVSDLLEKNNFSTNSSLDGYSVNNIDENYWITAPTKQQVIDWFREKHFIDICIQLNLNHEYSAHIYKRFHSVNEGKDLKDFNTPNGSDYYLVKDKAIEEALKLI